MKIEDLQTSYINGMYVQGSCAKELALAFVSKLQILQIEKIEKVIMHLLHTFIAKFEMKKLINCKA